MNKHRKVRPPGTAPRTLPSARSRLRFSLERQAVLVLGQLGFIALGMYFAVAATQPGRLQAKARVLELGDGFLGIAFGGGMALLFGWYLGLAVWRFMTSIPAIAIRDDGLHFHRSISRHTTIAWHDLAKIVVERSYIDRNWLFGKTTHYELRAYVQDAAAGAPIGKPIKCNVFNFEGGLKRACRFAAAASREISVQGENPKVALNSLVENP